MAKQIRNTWLWISKADSGIELQQLRDEGRDVSSLRAAFRRLMAMDDDKLLQPKRQARAAELLDTATELKPRKGYEFVEPSDLAGIRKLRPRGPRRFRKPLADRQLRDRILGAWLGRCVGCLLGKPIEGVRTNRLWPFLKLTRQWPMRTYLRLGVRGKAAEEYPDLTRAVSAIASTTCPWTTTRTTPRAAFSWSRNTARASPPPTSRSSGWAPSRC